MERCGWFDGAGGCLNVDVRGLLAVQRVLERDCFVVAFGDELRVEGEGAFEVLTGEF